MTQNYFTEEHFKLLNAWQGKVYDQTDSEQQRVYELLGQAYDITRRWADAVKQQRFKEGWCKTVRKPTDQWHKKFVKYNWGRIYPSKSAHEGLAYTVGIDATLGFVVKIDLVRIKIVDPTLLKKYEEIRGPLDSSSPIVAIKSIEEGVKLSFTELVDWSIESIEKFKPTYDEVAAELGLSAGQGQKDILHHFRGHKDFARCQPEWTGTTTELFSRLARAVNGLGLDWWFTKATNSQLRFGRKDKETKKGDPVGLLFLRKEGIRIQWHAFAGLENLEPTSLTIGLVERIEEADQDQSDRTEKLLAPSERDGYWPDDYVIEDDNKSEIRSENAERGRLPKNEIYYGPPGTGKTFTLQELLDKSYTDPDNGERYYEFVTFHQSYGYEDFVEGIRPVLIPQGQKGVADNDTSSAPNGEVRYEIKPGAFLRLCERAQENPSRQYAMVIDEINRGNISKIFGELITLIEVDKREGAKYPISLALPYSAKRFSVPLNVDVIGTMNTADRSLALVDTALRRRFEFIELMPKLSELSTVTVSHEGVVINIEKLLTMLNKRIEALYDRDHTVGHAYFMHLKNLKEEDRFRALQEVFRKKIIPLLEEYFFEDWQKIRLVLGDNQKSRQEHQFVHEIDREEDLPTLFGREHGLDQYAIRSRYQLNPGALDEADAYVGIYAPNSDTTTG